MSSENMQKRTFSESFIRFFDRWVPGSMVVVYLLTIIVAILALTLADAPFIFSRGEQRSLVDAWRMGFWQFLGLAMQMSLMLITGSIIASSPPVRKFLKMVAMLPNNMFQAILLVMAIVPLFNWFHFGFGIMLGIYLGRTIIYVSKIKGYKIHQPLFVAFLYACGFTGLGLSQIGPIFGTIPGALRRLVPNEAIRPLIPETVPLTESVLNLPNALSCFIILIVVFGSMWLMRPKKESDYIEPAPELFAEIEAQAKIGVEKIKGTNPAERADNSILFSMIIGLFGLIWVVKFFATDRRLDFDNFNFVMIIIGVLVCGSPNQFVKSVQNAINSIWGILIQFPFYAGIFGLIAYTGLNAVIVNFFMLFATRENWPFISYVYTSMINLAVPNGAAKWPIVGPYLLEVGANLQVNTATILRAYTAGDIATNGVLPFWALPYLAMFKLDFRKMLPYAFVGTFFGYAVFAIFFAFVY